MSLLLLFRPFSGIGGPPQPEPEPEVVRRGGGKRAKNLKRPQYWWEKQREEEAAIAFKPPAVTNITQPMHIVYDEPGLKADAKAEIEAVYRKRQKRKKRVKDIAAMAKLLFDD